MVGGKEHHGWAVGVTVVLVILLMGVTPARADKKPLAVLELGNAASLGTVIKGAEGAVEVIAQGPSTVCLGVVQNPGVDNCLLVYQAQVKTQGLAGRAYLEMWCLIPGKGEFFSRGMQNAVSGDADWTVIKTPFLLQAGQKPSTVVLSLVVAGAGKVWIKNPQLFEEPKP